MGFSRQGSEMLRFVFRKTTDDKWRRDGRGHP